MSNLTIFEMCNLNNLGIITVYSIYLQMNRSNGSQVLLRKMDLSLAGNFSCEVTADTSFATQIANKFVDVLGKYPILSLNIRCSMTLYRYSFGQFDRRELDRSQHRGLSAAHNEDRSKERIVIIMYLCSVSQFIW